MPQGTCQQSSCVLKTENICQSPVSDYSWNYQEEIRGCVFHMMEWITNRSRQSKQSELRVQEYFPVYTYRLKICKMDRSLWIPICKHIKDEKFLPFDQNYWLQQLSKVINSTGKRIGTNNTFSSLLKCVVFSSVTNVSVCKTSRECVLLQKEKLPKMLLWEKWKSMQHHSGCY